MSLNQKLTATIAEELQLPEGFKLEAGTLIADIPGWDSFAWIAIISAIERICEREFPLERVDAVKKIEDLQAVMSEMEAR